MADDARYRATARIRLDGIEVEHLQQDAGSGYRRFHQISKPTLVYMLPTSDRAALGTFDDPVSHRSFRPFGSVLALPPDTPLHVFSPPSGRREMIILRFDTEVWRRMPSIAQALDTISFDRWADIRSTGLQDTFTRMSIEIGRRDLAQATLLSGLALVALGELVRHLASQPSSRGLRLAPWQLRRMETRVMQEGAPPELAELADMCGISGRHLMRVFKASTGETVMGYIDRVRFERARQLLASQIPIKRISSQVGFVSQASFAHAFRRHFNVTPSEFRRHLRSRGSSAALDAQDLAAAE